MLAGVAVTGVSQVGVWWDRGFQAVCALSDPPQCGLAMGRTGAATIATSTGFVVPT